MTALAGSLGDLVARAEGRPIYCTTPWFLQRSLIANIVSSFRREFPSATFVSSRTLDCRANDRLRHWPAERERYGAGIVVTRGEGHRAGADPFAGLAGEHVLSIGVGLEIEDLVRLGRPVGWHPVVFPASYWLGRFAVGPFTEIQASRYARLLPAPDAEPFHPVIGPWPPVTDADSA
jgi:hypothetical protein